jgi:hypothetical protein
MPLLDHFHPPLSGRRQWESFHSAWAEALALQLNRDLLPPRYFAEVHVKVGSRVEIDVGTFEENGSVAAADGGGGVAVWAPPRPVLDTPLTFTHPDVFEVQVLNDAEGPHVVAAIELVSPANKDRASHRHMFAVKCASYLQQNIGLLIVDVVTERAGNLHADLLRLMDLTGETPGPAADDLHAAAYRTTAAGEGLRLQAWVEALGVGARLPTLPLWIGADHSLPIDLEQTYAAACAARRIP